MDNNPNDKIKTVTNEVTKMFKIFFTSIGSIFVAASILSSQHYIDVDSNQVLMVPAFVIAGIIIAYQGYVTHKVRQQKKLEQ
jgi:hypothetical protein